MRTRKTADDWGFNKPPVSEMVLDRSHPLARGLCFCVVPDRGDPTPKDILSGERPYVWTGGLAYAERSRFGWGLDGFAGGTLRWTSHTAMEAITNQGSIFCVARQAGLTSAVASVINVCYDYNAFASQEGLFVRFANGGEGSGFVTSVGNGASGGGLVGRMTEYNRFSCSFVAGSHVYIYIDGILRAARGWDVQTPTPTADCFTAMFNDSYFSSPNFRIGCAAAYVWNRELSADEHKWIYDEPYAFFKPRTKRTLFVSGVVVPNTSIITRSALRVNYFN
jgi:hypothetical protein